MRFEGLRVIGEAKDFAFKYSETGIDELFYSDAVASLYGRNGLDFIVRETCKEIFVPITVGGGIRSLEDAGNLLAAGAEKIAINTAAVKEPTLINQLAKRFGEQSIVLSVQAKRSSNCLSGWEVMIEAGREQTNKDILKWIKEAEDRGVGEVLVTSVDQDGTRKGPDKKLIELLDKHVSKPLIVCGGFNSNSSIQNAFEKDSVNAVAVGSSLHKEEINIAHLKNKIYLDGLPIREVISNYRDEKIKLINSLKNIKISILDYGMGNHQSLINAFNFLGADVILTRNESKLMQSNVIIMPGVGSFPEGMRELHNRELISCLKNLSKRGKLLIGICLGMQLLFEKGEEFTETKGLGLLKGSVVSLNKLRSKHPKKHQIKLPHIGWSRILEEDNNLLNSQKFIYGKSYYFDHSFAVKDSIDSEIKIFANYLDCSFLAICQKKNILGIQFHPERSGVIGLKLISFFIRNYLKI